MEHFVGYGKKTGNFFDVKSPPSASAIHVRDASWGGVCEIMYVKTR